jgi:hypothetical protein
MERELVHDLLIVFLFGKVKIVVKGLVIGL